MPKTHFRISIVLFAVVAFVTLLPDAASAAPCGAGSASTPAARADLWRGALERFAVDRPDFTPEQTRFIAQALELSDDLATPPQDERTQAIFIRKAKRVVERSRELFSDAELGQLFSSMGPMQSWLADVVAMTPYCDCIGGGSCSMGPGGPSGTCQAGCLSWDGSDGQRRDGLCGSPNVE